MEYQEDASLTLSNRLSELKKPGPKFAIYHTEKRGRPTKLAIQSFLSSNGIDNPDELTRYEPDPEESAEELTAKKLVKICKNAAVAQHFFILALRRQMEKPSDARIKLLMSLSLSISCGLRPAEIANGVEIVKSNNGRLFVKILGAKTRREKNKCRGIMERMLELSPASTAVKWIYDQVEPGGILIHTHTEDAYGNAFRQLRKQLMTVPLFKTWPKEAKAVCNQISPYFFRAAFAFDVCRHMSRGEASAAMGHLSTKSISSYSRRGRKGKGQSPIVSVSIGENDWVTCHETHRTLIGVVPPVGITKAIAKAMASTVGPKL